ncbi:thiamine pyrophosphate-dependent enzyme [Kitasatospora sp. NPDC056138]|uniref:thiamine pyrophosphate-dependent enzyme n=1 Tax=Kitasatospora sp. NPDC056138 TaxID=3345724 RepID=UPI0035D5DEDC
MNKTSAIAAVLAATRTEPTVFTTGYACRIANHLGDRPNHFYMTGSMGLAASIGIGIAQATRRTTVVVDGDGSLLMNPVGLVTAGALPDLPLLHIVLDDGRYASTGGQFVPSRRADLGAWAAACGYPKVAESGDPAEFAGLVRTTVADCTSPVLLLARLTEPDPPVPGRIDTDLAAHARRFQSRLARN